MAFKELKESWGAVATFHSAEELEGIGFVPVAAQVVPWVALEEHSGCSAWLFYNECPLCCKTRSALWRCIKMCV